MKRQLSCSYNAEIARGLVGRLLPNEAADLVSLQDLVIPSLAGAGLFHRSVDRCALSCGLRLPDRELP